MTKSKLMSFDMCKLYSQMFVKWNNGKSLKLTVRIQMILMNSQTLGLVIYHIEIQRRKLTLIIILGQFQEEEGPFLIGCVMKELMIPLKEV